MGIIPLEQKRLGKVGGEMQHQFTASPNALVTAILAEHWSSGVGNANQPIIGLTAPMPTLHLNLYKQGFYVIDFVAVLWFMDVEAESTPRPLSTITKFPDGALADNKTLDYIQFDGRGSRYEILGVRISPVAKIENCIAWVRIVSGTEKLVELPLPIVVHP